jgi:hypothetical protein
MTYFSSPAKVITLHSKRKRTIVLRWSEKLRRAKFARTFGARTHRAEILERVNSGTMSVGEIYFYGVVAYSLRGFRARLRLKHRQHARRNRPRSSRGRWNFGGFFRALVTACGARTVLAQINKIVMAGMAVRPCNVHTRACGHVNFHVGWLLTGVEWSGHFS